jgi:hypothetical protein
MHNVRVCCILLGALCLSNNAELRSGNLQLHFSIQLILGLSAGKDLPDKKTDGYLNLSRTGVRSLRCNRGFIQHLILI